MMRPLVSFLLVLLAFVARHVTVTAFSAPLQIRSTRAKLATDGVLLTTRRRQSLTQLCLSKSDGEETSENGIDNLLGSAGVISQPVVWISLYFVATTGGGLPEGPYGILGAVEGLAYLSVVGLVFRRIINSKKSSGLLEIAENLSIITLGASLLVLASLISKQGCIPN
ncbi:hypothetical protein ACHAWC_002129, partial [Mediolabrus comicus]